MLWHVVEFWMGLGGEIEGGGNWHWGRKGMRRTFSSGTSRFLLEVVTLTIWISKLPANVGMQPAGAEAEGVMSAVTACGMGFARADAARARRASVYFMLYYYCIGKCEECEGCYVQQR